MCRACAAFVLTCKASSNKSLVLNRRKDPLKFGVDNFTDM
jgi:hypothetical protein